MKTQLAFFLLSLAVGMGVLAGFACVSSRLHIPRGKPPMMQIWTDPAIAFNGAGLRVTVRVAADVASRGMIIAVDGGADYLTISSYELIPGIANTRTLELPRVYSANPDGLVLVTATLLGDVGPGRVVEKPIYRRQE